MIQKTIREISDAWREDKRPYVKLSTLAAYMLILENHILPKFGESNELHENDVQGFVLEKLEGGLSVKSVKDILIVLKMVMKFGVKNEWMNYYEWDIKYPTDVAGKKLEVLSVANHKKILNYIQSHFSFPGLGIYISLSTGLRIGEICALKWSDINVYDGILTVNRTIERIYIIEGERKHTELVINTPKTKNSCREIPIRMFICPRKRYLCCIKHCISICKFLKNIFGGQTGDKISHTKRKKNNKTTSQKNVLNCKRHGLSLAIILLCLSSSLGCRVRFCIISETPKAIVLHTKRKKQ